MSLRNMLGFRSRLKALLTELSRKIPEHMGLKCFFHPNSNSSIKRLQIFWVLCSIEGALALSYGAVVFFKKTVPQAEAPKPVPTSIETSLSRLNPNENWRLKLEEEFKKLANEVSSLKTQLQEKAKNQNKLGENASEDSFQEGSFSEDPFSEGSFSEGSSQEGGFQGNSGQSTSKSSPFLQGLQTKISQLENQLEEQKQALQYPHAGNRFSQNTAGTEQGEKGLIQKFTLNLSENPQAKELKTVDTTIPAGAFARTVLLSGLDASSAMTASSDPRPMLLRIIDFGTLPRKFQSDLKDCHCTASAYGDLSSERVYARLEKLTCVTRKTGEIIETQVAGYIAGPDGKAGIRGVVASKDGQFLGRSLMGGIFAGLSNVANPQNRQAQVNPFFGGGNATVSPPSIGETFASGMASGATTALDRLSQYYIDRAEQLQPIIQVAAGQVVDIVFTEGTAIGSAAEIRNQKTVLQGHGVTENRNGE